MLNFIKYLHEEETPTQGSPLKHLRHVEDHTIYGGHEGISQSTEALNALHNHLLGKRTNHTFTDKADGAPSLVYGNHPETGKFFVASKSAFNKNPKINYTEEDIDRNHGHAPGLALKLKEALKHLPKIMPKSGGVYQGDLMYGKGDVSTSGGHHHFTPNLLTYSVDKNSPEGQKVKNSKLGIVTHTVYKGKGGLENMSATPLSPKERKEFADHPDVNNIDNNITSDKVNPRNYTGEEQTKFHEHMENARKAYSKAAPEMYDSIKGHEASLEQHVNDQVRKGGVPSTEGYTKFLTDRAQKDIDNVKTEKSKQQKHQALANKLKEVSDNKKHFDDLLKIHGHLQNAKNVLLGVHDKNGESGGNPLGKTSINGNPSSGEGIVGTSKQGGMFKFVNRGTGGFAQQNLTGGRFQSANKPQAVTEEKEVRHVITYGRFNPITKGHQQSVEHIQRLAKSLNAGHTIVMSHSQDDKKNPLSAEQKLKHAKRAFPSANLIAATKEHPTLLHHLSKLHSQGVTHPTIVVGQDRVEDFKKLANKYNGVSAAHGHYNFKHINVQSSGPRTPGVSGTDMRKFASAGDEKSFASGAPTTMKPGHVKDMYNDVRNVMNSKSVKEGVTYTVLRIIKESLSYK